MNIKTFQVFPDVPEPLQPLLELAKNLWWVWQADAAELFRRLDRRLWKKVYHNPIRLLGAVSQAQMKSAATDEGYLAQLNRVYARFRQHTDEPGWFRTTYGSEADRKIAYFSAEFGLHESLPIYSGGLGVLAGDHLKSASEIGLPLTAVGLLYQQGYFEQYLSSDGWQQERYPELDFYSLAVQPVKKEDESDLHVRVDLPGGIVYARVWRVDVGRVPLYLLDTNLPENAPADREITSRLYGGGTEMRIRQEIVLGIGGVRALVAMGIDISVFHMNEGHSAFLAMERIRNLLETKDVSFDVARQQVMATNIFTTHTPVPAGIDQFPAEQMVKYFEKYIPSLKLDTEGFLALGREDVTNPKQGFSMAILALRLADQYNGVSKLHGEVARQMWQNIWPGVPEAEVPIRSITNGIHTRTWLSGEIAEVLERYFGESWTSDPTDQSVWADIEQVPDEELWRAHERCREKLVVWTRHLLHEQLARRGLQREAVMAADSVLDPEALTIGFARRFATYKRGALLLSDLERLKRLLDDTKRPIQFVFAGKSHPADHGGKELIKQLANFSRDPLYRRKFVFIENYDMNVARYLVQGVDVWLNNPRRPHEASGTSGMKAAANGVMNCSILDGWWVEGYEIEPQSGWAIGHGESYDNEGQQDYVESQALYDLLEKQIAPTFYDRGPDGLPREWVRRMKLCMSALAPVFNTNRMVREYAEQLYLPAGRRGVELAKDDLAKARVLADAKNRLRQAWPGVKVLAVHTSGNGHYRVGQMMEVQALVELGAVKPDDVNAQIYAGGLNSAGDGIDGGHVIDMGLTREVAPGRYLYTGEVACETSGRQGLAVRLVPGLANQVSAFEPGLMLWS